MLLLLQRKNIAPLLQKTQRVQRSGQFARERSKIRASEHPPLILGHLTTSIRSLSMNATRVLAATLTAYLASSAAAQLAPGDIVLVGQGNPFSVPIVNSFRAGVGLTSFSVNGLATRITSACYDAGTNSLYVAAGGAVFNLTFSGANATATQFCSTPGHSENWTLFIGHNGLPVATRPSGSLLECSATGATNLFPAPPWTTMQAASYDPITGRYYAITTDATGSAIYIIDPNGPNYLRIPSPVATSSVQDLFADGRGGVYLNNNSTAPLTGGLWSVDGAGNGVLLIDRAITGANHICRMANAPTCPLKFYSWGCLTGPDDDLDVLDAFAPGTFSSLSAIPDFGGSNGGIWDVVEVPGGPQGGTIGFGSGCVDSGNVVFTLLARGCHERGLSTGIDLVTGTGGMTFLSIGFSNTNWLGLPLPFSLSGLGASGCNLLVSQDTVLGPLANPGTGSSVIFPIPRDPLISGAQLYFQGLMIDFPAGNTLGLVTSNGAAVTIG